MTWGNPARLRRAMAGVRNDSGEVHPGTPIAFAPALAHVIGGIIGDLRGRGSPRRAPRKGQARNGMTMLQNGGTAAAAPDGLIKEVSTQTFVKDVIEES